MKTKKQGKTIENTEIARKTVKHTNGNDTENDEKLEPTRKTMKTKARKTIRKLGHPDKKHEKHGKLKHGKHRFFGNHGTNSKLKNGKMEHLGNKM